MNLTPTLTFTRTPSRLRWATRPVLWVLVLAVLTLATASAQGLDRVTLQVQFFQVTAEVAATPAQRAKGLMGRQSLPASHGMVFVFDRPEIQCFWMKNTPLPLTIAFIGEDGRIVNLADMAPFSEQSHCSSQPVRHALEMEQGWFKKRGILAGDLVAGLPRAAR